jgi:iron complex outermembrane receptor protein
MKHLFSVLMGLHLSLVMAQAQPEDQTEDVDAEPLEPIAVEGEVYRYNTVKLLPEANSVMLDTATVLKKMPGAYVNQNGVLSGIAQYRGLSGSRVNVNADGTPVMSSCSNAMDAPMSHVPASLVDAVVLQRGISPISQGMETLGGSIDVVSRTISRTTEGFSGELKLGINRPADGYLGAAFLQHRKEAHGWFVGVDAEQADNQEFPGGEINFTGLERTYYTAGYQYAGHHNQLNIDVNFNDTGETGTPALPMDITYARGGIASVEWITELNDDWQLTVKTAHQTTKHLMDNHRHRQQTAASARESLTRVERSALAFEGIRAGSQQQIHWGIEWDTTAQTADIFNPNNMAFLVNNVATDRDRISLFVEHQYRFNETHQLLSGIRLTQTNSDAARVFSSVAGMASPMGQLHQTLQDRFNAADRSRDDLNLDVMFNWQHSVSDGLRLVYGLAVKNRAPTHLERYLWLPLEATAGLADGRQYLGNLDLQSEQATQLELGLAFQQGGFSMTPHVFYHHINDYIQGTPNEVMPAPPGTLRYANVDARLYGIDVEWSWQLSDRWSVNQVISVVRGERRDIADELYRIAPANSWVNLTYQDQDWQVETEWQAAMRQNKVSQTNTEQATPGYGILNLAVSRMLGEQAQLKLAVSNVFDKRFYQHTNGYNRNNLNVDVGFDAGDLQAYRLPGQGRVTELNYFYRW